MIWEQQLWSQTIGLHGRSGSGVLEPSAVRLVFVFGYNEHLEGGACLREVRAHYPAAEIVGCTTAGSITHAGVTDDAVVVTAIQFESTRVRTEVIRVGGEYSDVEAGARLGERLSSPELCHAMVFGSGLVNGSALAVGLESTLGQGVTVTGGLAGDGTKFECTYVIKGDQVLADSVVAVGFEGSQLSVGHGSMGGWVPFGPVRRITGSHDNVLHELDGKPALDLYRKYLGKYADELPASALLFPLWVDPPESGPVVRTVLAIDMEEGSMTLAGDVPIGGTARLMRSSSDGLIDGAARAADAASEGVNGTQPDLALLVSCVGRKMILGPRTDEEVEAVRDIVGGSAALCGFYSYGELAPSEVDQPCELHNQTMTITTFTERCGTGV